MSVMVDCSLILPNDIYNQLYFCSYLYERVFVIAVNTSDSKVYGSNAQIFRAKNVVQSQLNYTIVM